MGELRACSVSYQDYEAIKHSVKVTAESLYEAAILLELECGAGRLAVEETEDGAGAGFKGQVEGADSILKPVLR